MLGLAHRGFALKDPTQHLAHTLRNAGYTTVLAGFQHVATDDLPLLGYDRIRDASVPAEDEAARFLSTRPSKPFFLDVGFGETHRVGGGLFTENSALSGPRHIRPPAFLPDVAAVRQDFANFAFAAERLDCKIGRVIDALEQFGYADTTLVIYTTDHGVAFPKAKCNLTAHGTAVALLMRLAGRVPAGTISDALVSHVDLYPTLCDLADTPCPPWLQGNSLLPLIEGKPNNVRDAICSEVTYHAAYEPMRSVRTERWNYIRRFGDRDKIVLPNCDDGLTKSFLLSQGWADCRVEREELYDVVFDPAESANVAFNPACADVLGDMRFRLKQWMVQTDDPLLSGPVELPPGAVANDPDGVSPDEIPTHQPGKQTKSNERA
jgi:arylsulfatase A-like enzyme